MGLFSTKTVDQLGIFFHINTINIFKKYEVHIYFFSILFLNW